MPERRPSVAVRISLFALLGVLLSPSLGLFALSILSPRLGQVIGKTFGAVTVVMAIAAIMLARRLFFPGWGSSPPGSSDGGGDGGGGSGPRGPSAHPNAPRGGIPLPDAEQSRERVRDHDRHKRRRLRPRRPAPEPERSPARTVPPR